MPSIEIIAVGSREPVDASAFPFAVLADSVLRSHRAPSRFQHEFDQLSGILYHLGNPALKNDSEGRFFFASKLLSAAARKVPETFLEFAPDYREGVQIFLAQLLRSSPDCHLVFTSDYQFGPDWAKREPRLSLREFWCKHDAQEIQLNALYWIDGE